ncbi:MAG TPA: aldehyde-activating protein [Allosphingosinicella sp.]|nr:aldehyde-activating protein [Allosphingosinicella sp.]
MLKLTCLCGRIRVETAKRPDFIHECNCTLCSKSGARWGYFHPSEVGIEGAAEGYCREDKQDPGALLQFCAKCGVTTHFVLTAAAAAKHGNVVMGVNMRLAEESDLAGVELRYPDGRAWAGEGGFGYVREARILGVAADSVRHSGGSRNP